MDAATRTPPTYTRYRLVDGELLIQAIEIHIAARAGESIAAFLERACRQYEWHIGDTVTFMLRGRHITQARITRQFTPGPLTTVSVSNALRTACREVAEYARGSTTFQVDENGVLLHRRTEFFVSLEGSDPAKLAARVGLLPDDDVSVGDCTAQVLRTTLRTGELISRTV